MLRRTATALLLRQASPSVALGHPRVSPQIRRASTTTQTDSTSRPSRKLTFAVSALGLAIGAAIALRPTEVSAAKAALALGAPAERLEKALAEISGAVKGEGAISRDKADTEAREKDLSYHLPETTVKVVVYPESEEEVAAVLKICNKWRVPVTPYGSGTSIEGNTVPTKAVAHGVVLDISRMNKILAVYPDDMQATVQGGVSWNDLNAEVEEYGLFFAPDPGTGASIGGMCATSCSGTRAYRYGTMKVHLSLIYGLLATHCPRVPQENVISLRIVLPSGRIVRTRRRPNKSSAGYDLTRLFIGTEGTIGIVTEVTVKLKNIPENLSVALVSFDDISKAGTMVQDLFRSPLPLHRLELMDSSAMRASNLYHRTSLPESHTLMVEFSGTKAEIQEQASRVRAMAESRGAVRWQLSKTQEEFDEIWSVRRNGLFSTAMLRPDVPASEITTLVTDTAVPVGRLMEALAETEKISKEMGIVSLIVAHIGDGNWHVLVPLRRGDAAEYAHAKKFGDRLAHLAVSMDGTCTGEHGVGLGKRHHLWDEVGKEGVEVMWELKNLFDPNNIMNPDHVLPPLDSYGKAHKH
ncbi:hypothetical protein HDU93_009153 [Gonapodya sp. JEL0774]|nr:hypothetical protein HDU93_009153 [Gonapodya sp. JEL0774]